MSNDAEKTKIISDENWKDQAKTEKEKLSEKQQPEEPVESAGATEDNDAKTAGALPPANFLALINTLILQALLYMGKLGDPNDKETKKMVNLDLAKHHIDLMGTLEEKTKGNLTEEESQVLSTALNEARMLYVQTASE